MKHLKSRHKDIIPKYQDLCKELDHKKKMESGLSFNVSPLKGETESYSGKKTSQQKISFDSYPRVLTRDSFYNYVVEYICDAVLPLYHTDRIEFRNFMKRLCPKLHNG
ncbi:hypothetical protein OUZ56_010745 [Daphnia magna]|uniref:Uncharacterized protein n=1 Tax=Daphnia magna TaxID=35525 RepID=A0ABQ9YYZ0_9CRUS|nr:hypothetical protein OUZ56_010745 [Daphnia magna]